MSDIKSFSFAYLSLYFMIFLFYAWAVSLVALLSGVKCFSPFTNYNIIMIYCNIPHKRVLKWLYQIIHVLQSLHTRPQDKFFMRPTINHFPIKALHNTWIVCDIVLEICSLFLLLHFKFKSIRVEKFAFDDYPAI